MGAGEAANGALASSHRSGHRPLLLVDSDCDSVRPPFRSCDDAAVGSGRGQRLDQPTWRRFRMGNPGGGVPARDPRWPGCPVDAGPRDASDRRVALPRLVRRAASVGDPGSVNWKLHVLPSRGGWRVAGILASRLASSEPFWRPVVRTGRGDADHPCPIPPISRLLAPGPLPVVGHHHHGRRGRTLTLAFARRHRLARRTHSGGDPHLVQLSGGQPKD